MAVAPASITNYPNVAKIRAALEQWADLSPIENPDPYAPRSAFLAEALKVCDEALLAHPDFPPLLAKLQFIEKVVLDG